MDLETWNNLRQWTFLLLFILGYVVIIITLLVVMWWEIFKKPKTKIIICNECFYCNGFNNIFCDYCKGKL